MSRSSPSHRALEALGAALAIATATWVLVVGGLQERAVALSALVVGATATLLLARRLAVRWPWAVPLAVVVTPAALAALPGRSLLGDGAVGYANASGALYLVAAAAAATLALRSPDPSRRRLATAAAIGWTVPVLLVRADTALLFAVLLALVLFVRQTVASRAVLAVGCSAVAATLIGVSVLGITYEPGPRTALLDRAVDATMGQTRAQSWHEAVSAIAEAPATGVGVGEFAPESPAVGAQAAFAHNEVLQVAAETGVAGGVLVALLLMWTFGRLWRSQLPPSTLPAAIALVGVAVQANTDFVLHFPPVVLALVAVVGTAAGLSPVPQDHNPPPASRTSEPTLTAVAGAAVATLLMVVASPLNATNAVPNDAEWTEDPSGVRFTADGMLRSAEEPQGLYQALTSEPGLSMEMWAATADLDQDGPARLVSSSVGIRHRNLTVGQSADALVVRLRTTETDWNAAEDQVEVQGVFTDTRRHHLVIAHDGLQFSVYVDGRLRRRVAGPGGSYAAWNFTYPLLLGNEKGGERPWSGRLDGVAFYDRGLSPAQVAQAFDAGPVGPDTGAEHVPAVARYTFADPGVDSVQDVSSAGLGPTMTRPRHLPGERDGFVSSFVDLRQGLSSADPERTATPSEPTLARVAGHVAVFAVLGVLVTRAAGSRWTVGRAVAFLAGGAVLLTLVLSAYRYSEGGAPSVLDVAAAAVGAVAGAAGWSLTRRR